MLRLSRTPYQQIVKDVLEIRRIVNMGERDLTALQPVVLCRLASIIRASRELAGFST